MSKVYRLPFVKLLVTSLVVSITATLTVLWRVILSPLNYEPFYRDLLPQFLPLPDPFFGNGYPNPAGIVTNTFFLPTVVSSLLPPPLAMKLLYASAVFIGSFSLFFAFKYFTRHYKYSLLLSSVLAYLLSVYPWTVYYDYWPNYYVVPTTLPLAFALADYFSSKYSGWKLGALLAISASIAVSDPRSFVLVPILIATFYIYKRAKVDKVKSLVVLASGLLFYALINLKTVISVALTFSSTVSTAYGVASGQLFLLNETFPLARVLALGAEFKPMIYLYVPHGSYLGGAIPLYSSFLLYIEALMSLSVFVVGGLLMGSLKRTPMKFFYFSSLGLVITMTSEVYIIRPVSVPLFPWLASVAPHLPFLDAWYWLFLPTYLNEYLIGIFYVALAIVLTKAAEVRPLGMPVLGVILVSLISSAAVTAQTGNLFGHLGPYELSEGLVGAMGAIGANYYLPTTNAKGFDSSLVWTPYAANYAINTSEANLIDGKSFALMGIPYYLSVGRPIFNLTYFQEVYSSGDITVYRSTPYNSTWTARGFYLVVDYPYDLYRVPEGYFAVPWFYPVKNASGIVGNSTVREGELYLLVNEYSVDPLTLPNFTIYVTSTYLTAMFSSLYPGAPLYGLKGEVKIYLNDSYLALAVLNATLYSSMGIESVMNVKYYNTTSEYMVYNGLIPKVDLVLIGPVKGWVELSVQGNEVPVVMTSIIPANAKPTLANHTVYLYSAASGPYDGGHQFMYWVFSSHPLHKVEYNLTLITLSSFLGLGITLFLVRREVLELLKAVDAH
mgnify:CR=1 FL=1